MRRIYEKDNEVILDILDDKEEETYNKLIDLIPEQDHYLLDKYAAIIRYKDKIRIEG